MRILMLVDAVYEDAVGGSRVVARELARGLTARGHEVTFVAPALGCRLSGVGCRKYFSAAANPDDLLVRRWPPIVPTPDTRHPTPEYDIIRFSHRGPLDLIARARRTVREVVAGVGADLLHVHFAYPAVGLSIEPVRGLPVVRSFYGSWASEAQEERGLGDRSPFSRFRSGHASRLRRAADWVSLRRSRRVIVLSHYSRDEVVREYGVPAERVDLVPGGVDLTRFRLGSRREARRRLQLPEDRRILLSVRRLVPRMGLDALIEAMVAVRQVWPDALLLVGGEGPLGNALRARAQQLGLEETVRFVGFIPDELLCAYYQAADLFLLPTRALEGFGLPTLEAFACGTPVLGTPVGAIREVLREVDPDLVLPGVTPEAIAEGVIAFFRQPGRPSLAAARLRAFAESRYSWDAVVDATLEVYRRAQGMTR